MTKVSESSTGEEETFNPGDQVLLPSGRSAEVVRTSKNGDEIYVRTASEPLLMYAAYELQRPRSAESILAEKAARDAQALSQPATTKKSRNATFGLCIAVAVGVFCSNYVAPRVNAAIDDRKFLAQFSPVSDHNMRISGELLSACSEMKQQNLKPAQLCDRYAELIKVRIDGMNQCITEAEAMKTSGKGVAVRDAFLRLMTANRDMNVNLRKAALKHDLAEVGRIEKNSESGIKPTAEAFVNELKIAGFSVGDDTADTSIKEVDDFVQKHDPGHQELH